MTVLRFWLDCGVLGCFFSSFVFGFGPRLFIFLLIYDYFPGGQVIHLKYGMLWYGMVWGGVVWYGMVWYGMVWYDVVWCGMVWCGMVWYGMV